MAEASTYKTAAGNAGGTEQILGRDVSSVIWHTSEPRNCPLNTLTGGDLYLDGKTEPQKVPAIIKKEQATEYKYEIIEKDTLGRTWQVNGAVGSTSEPTIAFDSTTGLQAGMILRAQNKDKAEIITILSVTNTTDVESNRNLGSSTFTIDDDTVFVCIGWAGKEGGSKRGIRSQLATPKTRYLQIYKNSFGITDTLLNSELVVEKDAWSEEMKTAAREHQLDKEFSMWFNPAVDSTTDASGNTVYMTRGIIAELGSTYTTNCDGSMGEAELFGTVAEDCFKYGPDTKLLVADARFISKISAMANVRLQMKMKETSYGIAITDVVTPHGSWKVVPFGGFAKFFAESEAGYAVSLDPDRVVLKYLKNRDSWYEENIQTPGDSVKEAQFVSHVGLSLRSLNHHRIIKNIG